MIQPLRIALFSPLPPAPTGIADYSCELIPYLAERAEVTVFAERPAEVSEAVGRRLVVHPLDAYGPNRWAYDVALYQMGNSHHHEAMYRVLRLYPGIVVLHDYVLHHFFFARTADRGDFARYGLELGYASGESGWQTARAVRDGRQAPPLFEMPLNDRVIDLSLGVIVHSDYVRRAVVARAPRVPTGLVQAPIAGRPIHSRRRELGWPEDAMIFGSFGLVTREKQIHESLRAFRRLLEAVPQARYLIVGDWVAGHVDLPALVNALNLADKVKYTGFVAGVQDLVDWIGSVDVVVNLRNPTAGETSAVALRALAAGRPLVVLDHGWYAELPDQVARKVVPGDDEGLVAAMAQMATDPDRRMQMGQSARDYAEAVHSHERAADAYVSFIRQMLAHLGPAPQRAGS